MRLLTILLASLVSALTAAAQDPPEVQLALGGLDPVELCSGKEVAGEPGRTTEHWIYRYRFANDENRDRFLAEPERYGIQMGGGCARMGPQSGKGDPGRFWVHDERIYIFASDACRETFRKDPGRFLDPDESMPAGDAERAAELIAQARAAHGGDRIAEMNVLLSRTAKVQEINGEEMEVGQRWTLAFPNRLRLDRWWGGYESSTVVVRNAGFTVGNDGDVEELHATAVRNLLRAVVRHPIVILRSAARDDFRAVQVGEAEVGGMPVELVAASVLGTTTTLAIDPGTGQVLSVRYRGRGPGLQFGKLEVLFSDFRKVGGILLPHAERVRFEGEDAMTREWTHEVDPELEEDYFKRD